MLDKFNIPPEYKKDWKTSPGFTNIRPITLDDCKKGTGQIEKIKHEEVLPKVTIGSIRLGSKRKGSKLVPALDETVIDVDRTNPILGNLYILSDHLDNEERDKVISLYAADLKEDEINKGPMICEIVKIGNQVLAGKKVICMCWCAPVKCHGDLIVERVNKYVREFLSDPFNASVVRRSEQSLTPQSCIRFGKYKNKEFSWIKQNDSGYWGWMLENIEGIEKQIPKNLL
jgi:hypothetical protein